MAIKTKSLIIEAQAPDSRGKFQGVIHANDPAGDRDGERIEEFKNAPTTVPLKLEHQGSAIGTASILPKEDGTLVVLGTLYLKDNNAARDVHRRMLLPSSDPFVLAGMSVGFAYDPATVRDRDGVKTIPSATLREVSLCRSADARQRTELVSVKSRPRNDKFGWQVAKELFNAGVMPSDPDFRNKALSAIAKVWARPATKFKAKASPSRDKRFVVSTVHPKFGVFHPTYRYLSELANRVAKIATDAGYPDLGQELRDIVMVDGIDDPKSTERHLSSAVMDRSRKSARCPRCRRQVEVELQDPVKGGNVVWAQTPCCKALLGWSPLPEKEYVAEMRKVRTAVDTGLTEGAKMDDRDLLAQLERVAGTKHLPRTTEAAYNAVRDAADVADEVRTQITYPSHDRSLLRAALELRQIAERLVETEGEDRIRATAATNALQRAEDLRGTAAFLRAGDHADLADRLEVAADKVTSTCSPLAARQLDPPPPVEMTGPKAIPQTNARFMELDDEPAPAVTGETFTVPEVTTETTTFRVEKE